MYGPPKSLVHPDLHFLFNGSFFKKYMQFAVFCTDFDWPLYSSLRLWDMAPSIPITCTTSQGRFRIHGSNDFGHVWLYVSLLSTLYIYCPVRRETWWFVQPRKFMSPELSVYYTESWITMLYDTERSVMRHGHSTWRLEGDMKICLHSMWRLKSRLHYQSFLVQETLIV